MCVYVPWGPPACVFKLANQQLIFEEIKARLVENTVWK